MNSKFFIGIVIVIVLIGGFSLFYKKGSYSPSINPQSKTESANPMSKKTNPASEDKNGQNIVTLGENGFSPVTLTVKAGTKVTWLNKSGKKAAINSDPHPIHTNYSLLNLGSFESEDSLSLTFDKAGTFGYHNHLNPSQKGTIYVL